MRTLYVLWSTFFSICQLRLKPQDLPVSSLLLNLSLGVYTITSIIITLSLLHISIKQATLLALLDTTLLILLTSSLLFITHYAARINQTLTALAGTNSVIGILSIPLIFWLEQIKLQQGDVTLPWILLVGLVVWNFVVYVHILRHALDVPIFIGFFLTAMIYLLNITLNPPFIN